MVARRRNSPCSGRPSTSSRTVCSRSPCATAVIACVTAVVGHSRSSIRLLTEVSISPQAPPDRPSFTRVRVLPSRPTTWPTCSSSCAMRSLAATISLNVSAILPSRPVWSVGRRTEKSPVRIACKACSSFCSPKEWPLRGSPVSCAAIAAAASDASRERSVAPVSTRSILVVPEEIERDRRCTPRDRPKGRGKARKITRNRPSNTRDSRNRRAAPARLQNSVNQNMRPNVGCFSHEIMAGSAPTAIDHSSVIEGTIQELTGCGSAAAVITRI